MDKDNFHADEDIRIDNQRHAAIILKESSILLIHRVKRGLEFYAIPGGHGQIGEKGIDTVKREVAEETSLITTEPKLVFEFKDYKNNNFDCYYICDYISGKAKLNGEENIRNSKDNSYELEWVELSKVYEYNILPKFAKEWIEKTLVKVN